MYIHRLYNVVVIATRVDVFQKLATVTQELRILPAQSLHHSICNPMNSFIDVQESSDSNYLKLN